MIDFIDTLLAFFGFGLVRKCAILRKNIAQLQSNLKIFAHIKIDKKIYTLAQDLATHLPHNAKTTQTLENLNQTISLIKSHNETIKNLQQKLDNAISKHSAKSILAHIDTYSLESIRTLNEIALQIATYKLPNSLA